MGYRRIGRLPSLFYESPGKEDVRSKRRDSRPNAALDEIYTPTDSGAYECTVFPFVPSTAAANEARQVFERPVMRPATRSRVTVILFDSQREALDARLDAAAARTGRRLCRSAVIRALVDTLIQSDLSLTDARDEAELRSILSYRYYRPEAFRA